LPTPGKTFQPDQPKNSAAGEKDLPLPKNVFLVQNQATKKLGPFLALFI
jgi:hypothetical protein